MKKTIGIVGAGLLGRLVALEFACQGWKVSLYDQDDQAGTLSCGYTGAGMLAPYVELEAAEPIISGMGIRSLQLWPSILEKLTLPVFFQQQGTLVVAHPSDRQDLEYFKQKIVSKCTDLKAFQTVHRAEIDEIEPELNPRLQQGLYFPTEGQVDNRQLMISLAYTLKEVFQVEWYSGVKVDQLTPHQIFRKGKLLNHFDWVVDCRGLGARADLAKLRGVRGEIITIEAPDVILNRPVRLIHPRYPIYVVPRQNHRFIIGATAIESNDNSPISVQSMLELLSVACTLHQGFIEARILEVLVNCRPAFPNNQPLIKVKPGFIQVNGLYRHGFLIAPALVHCIYKNVTAGLKSKV